MSVTSVCYARDRPDHHSPRRPLPRTTTRTPPRHMKSACACTVRPDRRREDGGEGDAVGGRRRLTLGAAKQRAGAGVRKVRSALKWEVGERCGARAPGDGVRPSVDCCLVLQKRGNERGKWGVQRSRALGDGNGRLLQSATRGSRACVGRSPRRDRCADGRGEEGARAAPDRCARGRSSQVNGTGART